MKDTSEAEQVQNRDLTEAGGATARLAQLDPHIAFRDFSQGAATIDKSTFCPSTTWVDLEFDTKHSLRNRQHAHLRRYLLRREDLPWKGTSHLIYPL